MITIFNRRELTITFSMEQQSNIRSMLKLNKINYTLRIVNTNGSSRTRFGTFGQNMDFAHEYIFYVHKNDLPIAQAFLSGSLK